LIRLSWEDQAWEPAGTHEIQTWTSLEDLERDGTIAVNLQVADIDDDGSKEILARFRLAWMCCGAGATGRRTLVVVNDDQAMSEAAYVHLDELIYRGGTTSKHRFEDRDHDGHRDLVVQWTAVYEDEDEERGETVYAWKVEQDRFKGARRPRGEACVCE